MTAPDLFHDRLSAAAQLSQSAIEQVVGSGGTGAADQIAEAMIYATKGGKGLRAFLVVESAALFGISSDRIAFAAGAIEALHAYSLIHDDLPCMDDDDLRRGKPTVHKKWNEATAVLAGDALQTLAFQMLGSLDLAPARCLDLINGLAAASGVRGMVGGQAADIAAEKSLVPLDLGQIASLMDAKTGRLFNWAATVGPIAAGEDLGPLAVYANAFGQAYQISDDLLDATGDEETAGKRLNKDADAGKATYVSLLGEVGARAMAQSLVAQAKSALDEYGDDAKVLCAAADFAVSRDR